ncbi:TonB-dependent receptor [Zobellia galactanivorans]|uniref:TonB-dependent receptor n=1 Tax=Zobellia galactanivorans (strain DSM 12802 / CCUG 47099 / CIP 106680 / NCIMB 13871 / Dsij) TaxID=63186 RepID=UPI001C073C2F|nr:TonB-dependent receptor [Zobellia galactanivorans]MBU3026247.1 TonB-dependent receptor [Zobellia galactanivorans]
MMYRLLGMWLCFSLCLVAHAQSTFDVEGVVLDGHTLKPIKDVNILSKPFFAISNDNGEFKISDVPKGKYTFTVSHIAYGLQHLEIEVDSNHKPWVIRLQEAVTNLEGIELSATTDGRKAQELATISVAVSKAFLEGNRENSLMQTLKKIPGVSTISIGSGQSKPVIRGLGFNRVSVVQNGIKHEAQQWGNDHGLEIDQYGVENVQIIKGPASLLYGSDAISGVVDIEPPSVPIPHTFEGEVNLLGETNNALLGVSTGVQGRKETWFYRGRLTLRDYGDYKVPTDKIRYESYIFDLHDNHLRNTAGQEANVSFSLGYLGDGIKSETFFSDVFAKNGFFANAHGLEVRTSAIDYDGSSRDVDLPFHQVNHFKVVNNTTFFKDKHIVQLDFGFQNNQREEHSEPVPHGYMPKPADSRERIFSKNTLSLNAKTTYKPNEAHSFVFGLNGEMQNNNIGGWGFLIPEYERYNVGAYVFDHYKLKANFHLQGGIRYDWGHMSTQGYRDWFPSTVNNADGTTSYVYMQRSQERSLDFNSVNGSVGLSYHSNKTIYKLNLGKSFRMPLPNELASDGVNYHMYRYERGNIDLDPERSYQIDADIEHKGSRYRIGVSPFLNFFGNFIYLNPTSGYNESLQVYEYVQSKVVRYGGELSAGVDLNASLSADASLEYVYSRQASGPKKNFTLPFSPPLSALFSINYRFNDLGFLTEPSLNADLRVTAEQNKIVPPEERTDGYQVLNLSATAKLNLPGFERPTRLRVKLNNVFHTEYYDHTSFYRLIDVPEAGRNISLSITIPF